MCIRFGVSDSAGRQVVEAPGRDCVRSVSGGRNPRITEERELYAVRAQLQRYQRAVAAILQTAANLRRPVETLRPQDVRCLG